MLTKLLKYLQQNNVSKNNTFSSINHQPEPKYIFPSKRPTLQSYQADSKKKSSQSALDFFNKLLTSLHNVQSPVRQKRKASFQTTKGSKAYKGAEKTEPFRILPTAAWL
ncbi:hypothetical protein PoB_006548000 [Plakobranchus ocellatus]|uniref:Uncharacterized protein n=1 Tax=Plakobranchus ocellatus TaxID=259542 RepID=A0AAV4D4F6_9GAST|nr:hypothetical protein PoB_006548000 [Plakobranchus ocellatus]